MNRWASMGVLAHVLVFGFLVGGIQAQEGPTLTLTPDSEFVRIDHLYRCHVRCLGEVSGAVHLAVALLQGDQQIARTDIDIPDARSLREPARIVVGTARYIDGTGPALRLVATLDAPGSVHLVKSTDVTSLEHLRVRFSTLDSAFGAQPDLLPALWLEQAALAAIAPPTLGHCRALTTLCDQLTAWQAGQRPTSTTPGSHVLALRDPVDGSVQPFRIHRSDQPGGPTVLLLRGETRPTKIAWPMPPESVLAPLLACGATIIEPYPAGDDHWSGCALLRTQLTWQAAGLPLTQPRLIVGIGHAAHAAILLAERHPEYVSGIVLLDADWPVPPKDANAAVFWSARHGGRYPERLQGLPLIVNGRRSLALDAWLGQAQTAGLQVELMNERWASVSTKWSPSGHSPIGGIADRTPTIGLDHTPVTIVVGSGEHDAARNQNQLLANALLARWVAHAQGAPPVVLDTVELNTLRGRHLICIGNPRSNRILATLTADTPLPVQWDARSLHVGEQTWIRAERRPVVLRIPRPDEPNHVVLVLDGSGPWVDDDLPTASFPDLLIGTLPGQTGGPALQRWFDSRWRP